MFYEAIGMLIENAGKTLTARHDDERDKDVRDQREFRQITLLLARVGAMWPHLFTSLGAELDVLDRTLADALAAVPDLPRPIAARPTPSDDPLQRYRQVLADLDAVVAALHEQPAEPGVEAARRRLRHGLAEAAELQGRLVDLALAV